MKKKKAPAYKYFILRFVQSNEYWKDKILGLFKGCNLSENEIIKLIKEKSDGEIREFIYKNAERKKI